MKTYVITAFNEEGLHFPRHYVDTFDPRHHVYPFRLLCADNKTLAYGLSEHDSNFDPLDDYQEAWGCVTIEYWDQFNARWEPL